MTVGRGTLAVLLLGLAVIAGSPTPVAADAPTPTNYRSEVLDTEPALPPGVELEVVGGDSFLELRVDGHRVEVPDYDEATAYLRFQPDGTVQRNRLALATAANEDRFGSANVTPDPDAPPEWETVATDGAYAWHDHRIHWMSPNAPTAVDADGQVDLGGPNGRWQLPVVVDGTRVTVTGQLWLRPAPPVWPAALLGTAATAGLVAAGRRRPRAATVVALVVAGAAVVTSLATTAALPAGIDGSVVPLTLAAVAVVAALVALWAHDVVRRISQVAVASTLLGWGLARVDVLTRAELPTVLAAPADRAVTVAALAVGVAIGILLVAPAPADPARSAVSGPAAEGS